MATETQTVLGEVLRDPERFPWDHALYASPDRAFDPAMPVLIWDVDDVEGDSDVPAQAGALGFDYVLGMQTVQSIISNALQQRPDADIDELLEALDFYYRNDAFVVWTRLPEFPQPPVLPGLQFSIALRDLATGELCFSHLADTTLHTASVGKIFLLIAVCSRFADGRLDRDAPLAIPAEHEVADSGLLYLFRNRAITVADACLLVGAVSDNLATNGLIALLGLPAVRAVAGELGFHQSAQLDFIRNDRGPGMPDTPSAGSADELSALMCRLWAGRVVGPEVSAEVLHYLAADTDVSMVAGGLHVDPLAHMTADDGITLRHKTGCDSHVRADVGVATGPAGGLGYAVIANWHKASRDLRVPVQEYMYALGRSIRQVAGR